MELTDALNGVTFGMTMAERSLKSEQMDESLRETHVVNCCAWMQDTMSRVKMIDANSIIMFHSNKGMDGWDGIEHSFPIK